MKKKTDKNTRSMEPLSFSDALARTVLNSLSAHIAILDENGVILETNKAWQMYATKSGMPETYDHRGINYLKICDATAGSEVAGADKVAAAMRIILSDQNVKAVLYNIFGGITRCDEVAKGILAAMKEVKPKVPMVVRLVGTNAEEGRALLADAKMITAETLADAAQKAVAAAQGA